jgi:Tfp pilus assembly protein PilN
VIENLNLASQPFRNRTLPWTVAAALALAAVAVLAFTFSQLREVRARAATVVADVRALRTESDALRQQAEEVNRSLTDDQRRTLEAAHLIVDRKNFSWSRLLADLEATLPQGVRVSRITVRDADQSAGRVRADLDLAVVARNADDVTRMMAEMARTGIFSADLLTQSPAPKGESGIEATLRVHYTPSSRTAAPRTETASAHDAVESRPAADDATRPTTAAARRPGEGGEAR